MPEETEGGVPMQARIIDFLVNALTDPRVAAEAFPFDRPTLFSERLADLASFVDCAAGPGEPPIPDQLTSQDGLDRFDHDSDGDVDMGDFASLQPNL